MIKTWMFKPYRNLPSTEHLVGYWPFNETSGTNAPDLSGNGNDGTLVNSPTWVDGVVGKCLDFDGTDEYVSIAASADFDFRDVSTSPFTLTAWVKPTTSRWNSVFSFGTINYQSVSFAVNASEQPTLTASANGSSWTINYHTDSSISLNVYSLISLTRDTSGIYTFYINGEIVDSLTYSTDILLNNYSVKVGGHYSLVGGTQFVGNIDEVRIYSTALTASEIKALYDYPGGV